MNLDCNNGFCSFCSYYLASFIFSIFYHNRPLLSKQKAVISGDFLLIHEKY